MDTLGFSIKWTVPGSYISLLISTVPCGRSLLTLVLSATSSSSFNAEETFLYNSSSFQSFHPQGRQTTSDLDGDFTSTIPIFPRPKSMAVAGASFRSDILNRLMHEAFGP